MCENNKQEPLCTHCLTGKESYILDNKQCFCPYVNMYENNMCAMFCELSGDVNKSSGQFARPFTKE